MKITSKGLEVFDFDVDDDFVEKTAERFTVKGKHRNPKTDTSPITKYRFLECFSRGIDHQQLDISDVTCIDVDSSNSSHKSKTGRVKGDDFNTEGISEREDVLVPKSSDNDCKGLSQPDSSKPLNFIPGGSGVSSRGLEDSNIGVASDDKHLSSVQLDFLSNSDPIDTISDDGESVKADCLSTHSSTEEVSLEDPASDHYSSDWDMENTDLAVVVTPDYLTHGERYCTESFVTFSSSGIELEGTNAYGEKESFRSEWAIDEVASIESQWYLTVQTALITLRIRSTAEIEAENVDQTSGIFELKFAVCDPSWAEKLERILSLDARYRAVWKLIIDANGMVDGVEKNSTSSRRYFPNLEEPFEDVIYPQGDPDAVTISKRDVELLEPQTFINDTIIDFYVKYLKNKISHEEVHRFHFFNSFFFRKLADLDKDPASASQGRAAFQRVRKWTRKVNLFEKDYIFIPVNFNLHWSLIVICHPGEIANFEDEDTNKSLKVPCILHMDSIKGSHKGLKNLIQSYLWEEWKEKISKSSEDFAPKFLNLRFVPLQVPQQENSFDCGLFLLQYVELFLEEAPVCFSPFKITEYSNFLNADWFTPAEASSKRVFIQNLIYELVEDNSERIATTNNDEHHLPESAKNDNSNKNGVEIISETSNPSNKCHGFISCPTAGQGIQMERLPTSSGGADHVRDSKLVQREFFQRGTTSGPLSNADNQPSNSIKFRKGYNVINSPIIEEDIKSDELFESSPSTEADIQSVEGLEDEHYSFSARDFCRFDSVWDPGMLDQEDEKEDGGSSSETSNVGSQDPSEVGVGANLRTSEFAHKRQEEEAAKPRSVSPGNIGCITGSPASASSSENQKNEIVEDSQEVADMMAESKEGTDSHITRQENPSASPNQVTDLGENRNHSSDNMPSNVDNPTFECDEQRATKRQRLLPPLDSERQGTSSVPKDWQL